MKKHLAILLIFFHILPSIPFAQQAQSIAVIEFEGLGISQTEANALTNELEIYLPYYLKSQANNLSVLM